MMGSGAEVAQECVEALTAAGEKIGCSKSACSALPD